MGILTGREDGLKMIAISDLAFVGTLSDYSKGSRHRLARRR